MKENEKHVTKKSSNLRKKTSKTSTTVTADVSREEKSKTKVDTEEGSNVSGEKATTKTKASSITLTKTKSDEVPRKASAIPPRIKPSKEVKKPSNFTAKIRVKPSKSDLSGDKPRTPSAVSSQTSIHSNKSGTKINMANHTGNTVIEEQDGSGSTDARCKKSIKDWALGVIKGGLEPLLPAVVHCSAGVGRTGSLVLITMAQ